MFCGTRAFCIPPLSFPGEQVRGGVGGRLLTKLHATPVTTSSVARHRLAINGSSVLPLEGYYCLSSNTDEETEAQRSGVLSGAIKPWVGLRASGGNLGMRSREGFSV